MVCVTRIVMRMSRRVPLHSAEIGERKTSATLASSSSSSDALSEANKGPFQNVFVKPFPVRAAIDLGSGGCASLSIGCVDAQRRAVRTWMHRQQVPLRPLRRYSEASMRGVMHPDTVDDLTEKLRLFSGVRKRAELRGVSEVAAVISYPLCLCSDAPAIAKRLSREFALDVRVLGVDFEPFPVAPPPKDEFKRPASVVRGDALTAAAPRRVDGELLELLAFDAVAAASECVARHRLIAVEERSGAGGSLALVGWSHDVPCVEPTERSNKGETCDGATTQQQQRRSLSQEELDTLSEAEFLDAASGCSACAPTLLRHPLPVSASQLHDYLLQTLQKRVGLNSTSVRGDLIDWVSPNPVLRQEWSALVDVCHRMLAPSLPPWVRQKSLSGGVICGASSNGGVLNTAARVSQQVHVSLSHLETTAEHHYCGLTDVLLSENYPFPAAVLTHAALAAGLMRALQTPRIRYLPEVHMSDALLVARGLWLEDRAETVRAALSKQKFFRESAARFFQPPPPNSSYRAQPVPVDPRAVMEVDPLSRRQR